LTALGQHFKARGITPKSWFFNTDGAPSHFKNRFTMHSLFKFKTKIGATTVVWETCAPGHGKGPWDGIGAVIKSLIRRLELHEKIYVQGARDVFLALLLHGTTARVGSRVSISEFVYHYVLLPGEPPLDGHANVWPCIVRPSVNPNTTRIPGIRDTFCFRTAEGNVMAVRELSCRCICCLQYRWKDCKNEDAGEWRYVAMSSTPAAAGLSTRGQRAEISKQRRDMAKSVLSGEVISLESADDPEGFTFWLARAEGPAQKYTGPAKMENGRKYVPNTWYIRVRYYNRFPVTSHTTFKLSSEELLENAEGVTARKVKCTVPQPARRSARGSGRPNAPPSLISLAEDEVRRLEDIPALNSL